jgi:hypothetical protein
MPLNIVYVRKDREHWKEDCCWKAKSPDEALRLARWLIDLGLDAQRIDDDVYAAMPERIER